MARYLADICNNIAVKVLGKPGTVVECMEGCCDMLIKGKQYTVDYIDDNKFFMFKEPEEDDNGWLGTRFRKVDG